MTTHIDSNVFPLGTIAALELLRLWSDLEEARHGTADRGGGTVEIYAYRLGCMGPAYHTLTTEQAATDQKSARALHALLQLFQEHHPEVGIDVDGEPLGAWVQERPFKHRCHVTVTLPREDRARRASRARHALDLAEALEEAADLLVAPVTDTRSVTEAAARFRALAQQVIG